MKVKSANVFLVIVTLFLLVGCQTKSPEPVKAEIVLTNWEYTELGITCSDIGTEEGLPCFSSYSYPEKFYPDRVSILNEFGKSGWEVISQIPEGVSVYYLLKRPLLP